MKSFIKALALSAAIFTASYQPAMADEYCSNIKEISATIMKYRQEGSSYQSLYGIAVKNDASAGGSLEQIFVQRAFTFPRLYDMEARDLLIADFSKGVYERCVQATSK